MKKLKILMSFCLFILCSGCYNFNELNDLEIVSAVGIDKIDDKYLMTVQIVNTIKEGADTNASSAGPRFYILKAEGDTVHEAFRKIELDATKKLYSEQIILFVIGESAAKEDLKDILDLSVRDSESTKQYQTVVADGVTAHDILSTVTALIPINANKIVETIESSNLYFGTTKSITLEEVIGLYLNPKKEVIIPTITITDFKDNFNTSKKLEESEISSKLTVAGAALFKDNKLLKTINYKDSVFLSFLKNEMNRTVIDFNCSDKNKMTLEILKSKSKIMPTENEVTINIEARSTISEINCNVNLEDEKEIKKLEKKAEKYLKDSLNEFINNTIIKNEVDLLNLQDTMYKNNNKLYKEYDNWKIDYFNNINYKINTKIKIANSGNTIKVINDK